VRDPAHPLRPKDYRPLDTFWQAEGFERVDLTTTYEWQDIDQLEPTAKPMQYWLKRLP
jgi:hypothetical protein